MIQIRGRFIPNVFIGAFDTEVEFVALPMLDEAQEVKLYWTHDRTANCGSFQLNKSENGYSIPVQNNIVPNHIGQAMQAYISIHAEDDSWKSKSFYISVAPLIKFTITPRFTPDDIDAIIAAAENQIE